MLKNNTVEKHLKKWETIQQLFLSEFKTEMYVTRLRSMEHSSAHILTHCVDGDGGDGIGVGVRIFLRNRMMWNRYSLHR